MSAEDKVRAHLLKASKWLTEQWYAADATVRKPKQKKARGESPDEWYARVRPQVDARIGEARALMAEHAEELGLQNLAIFEKYRIHELSREVGHIMVRLGRLPSALPVPPPHPLAGSVERECSQLLERVRRDPSAVNVVGELARLYQAALQTGDVRMGDLVGACAVAAQSELREAAPPLPPAPPRPSARRSTEIWDWPHGPIPANATSVATIYIRNGVYGRRDAQGNLTFLVRVVGGKSEAWLNLGTDSGHFDEGSSGQAYYADGFMEDFSNWDDDSPRYPATMSFQEWSQQWVEHILAQPIPDSPDATVDPPFQARTRALFSGSPAAWRAPASFPSGLLELLRRLPLLAPDCYTDRAALYQALRSAAGLSEEWALYLTDMLPLASRTGDFFYLSWKPPAVHRVPLTDDPLVSAVARLGPDYAEARLVQGLSRLAAWPVAWRPPPAGTPAEQVREAVSRLAREVGAPPDELLRLGAVTQG